MKPFRSIFKSGKNLKDNEIAPDEIFLDSSNLPNFDVHQFEGRFEKPITKKTILLLASFFVFVGIIFIGRVGVLQISKGDVLNLLGTPRGMMFFLKDHI